MWNAAVKSTEALLYRILLEPSYTFEEFSAVSARIEAVKSSRSLCAVSSDTSEVAFVLTPNHFLIGSSMLSAPERPV